MNIIILKLIKILLFIVTLYFLFKYELLDIFSVAYCNTESFNTEVSTLGSSYALRTATVFSGSMLLLKSMPLQVRGVTSLAIATSHAIFTVGKRVSDSALESKIANETSKSASNSGFKSCSIIEKKWDVYFQSEYFIFLVCFLLIILALISFTIIVFWIIVHKYSSWVVFLNKKTQSNLVLNCIEKIKKISALKIIYLVFFFYVRFFICVYLLLTCF